jgi:ligand-binding sensor domain-containing protein/anti-sigma regulatory factor (Ser/Thr protein kinase)
MSRIFLLLFLLVRTVVPAQHPAIHFDRVTTQNGLSNNQVNCILQDRRGFMWIGTNDGLNRYDGNYFLIFRNVPGDSATISGNMITDLLEDEQGLLWIATADGGLCRYNYKLLPALQFKQYKHLPGNKTSIPTNSINKLLAGQKNYLWLATNGFAVIRFNKQTEQFDQPVSGGPNTVFDIEYDGKGILWAGRQGGGILKIDPVNLKGESDKRYQDLYARLPHAVVTSLYRDRNNHMWYGSWDKVLYRFDPVTQMETVYAQSSMPGSFINDEISVFAEDRQGRLWMGGKTGGLQVYDPSTRQFHQHRHDPAREGTVASNMIRSIYADRSGRIWIGTNRGISVSNPSGQQFVQTFLPAAGGNGEITLYDFYRQENGDLWIGTSNGIYIQRRDAETLIHRPVIYKGNRLAVSKFFTDSKGVFYVGTNYSLFVYDRKTGALQLLPNTEQDKVMNRIIESRIVSVLEDTLDGKPVLVVSPYGHFLAYYDLIEKKWVSRLDSVKKIITTYNIKDYLIRKLYKAKNGKTWLANTREGLGEWDPDTSPFITYYKNDPYRKEGLSNNSVYDVVEDANGNLWISTYGGGLNYLDISTGKIQHIPATNNLLEGISLDRSGNVWMISDGNLQRYNRQSKSGASFHLPDLEKSGGVTGYIYRDNTGKMYVAGKNYFIAFEPDSIRDYRKKLPIFLTGFRIFNESYGHLLEEKTIRLGYRQNYFTIEFSAPEYSLAEPVQYAYMLEGWDKEWVSNGTRNYATFSNLEGGTYTFRVRASSNPGVWTETERPVTIIITPPFWKRWWFYLLCVLLIAGIIYAFYRYRINELVKRQAIRNKIAQDLHDSVGSTLSSISVYSQVAKIYREKKQEAELEKTLEKISDTSGEMISEMNDIVWTINPRNDNTGKIFQRMESFAKPLLQTKGIHFSFVYDDALLTVQLPMEKRKNFYLIFKEAINNVLKYSQCKNLDVAVKLHQHQVSLVVRDDGQGFDTKQLKALASRSLSGNGLNNMKRRAAEMKGECWIESAPGKGTTVHLRFPVT